MWAENVAIPHSSPLSLDLISSALLIKWMQETGSMNNETPVRPVALVTGGSRGLGREIVLRLFAEGYEVVINYLSSKQEAFVLAQETGGCAVKADVARSEDVRKLAEFIEERFGRLHVVVNNAGVSRDNLLLRQSGEDWDEVLAVNLTGCFHVTKSLSPLMARSRGGSIINISSYSGMKGASGQAAYSASKAALLGFTRSAAIELAEYGIRVNAVLPGYMMTEMGMNAPAGMQRAKAASLLGMLSDPVEVSEMVAAIIKTKRITGQVFSMDSRIL
jgi:3-oxoacyl-[acyl-carrier protein] reductase